MSQDRWIQGHCPSLEGKTVAVTGATGGLGREICRNILALGGRLLLLNRSREKTEALIRDLIREFPEGTAEFLFLDLTDFASVRSVCRDLESRGIDILLHNAGIYDVPRVFCDTGLLNVFQVNFAAPYYMTRQLLPMLERRHGRVTVVGSIAHTYAPTDPEDPDFRTRARSSPLVYGNSKRFLMFAFGELRKDFPGVEFSIGHPGITLTNISNHYPPWLYPLIRPFLKLLFPGPRKACRSIVFALCHGMEDLTWCGPRYLNLWGPPALRKLSACSQEERRRIYAAARSVYEKLPPP